MGKPLTQKIEYVDLDQMEVHPNNPRYIEEADFEALKGSLNEDPMYFEGRPIICSNRTGKNIVIAGNQRFLGAQRLGWKNAPTMIMKGLTEADEVRIMLKDNGSYGKFDWDIITNMGWDELIKEFNYGIELPFDPETAVNGGGGQSIEDLANEFRPEFKIEISVDTQEEQEALHQEITERGLRCRIITV